MIKKTILAGMLLCVFFCSFQEQSPILTFESRKHNFGFIHQGDVLEHDYFFTNSGKSPLIILGTKSECGCTMVSAPSQPILPGESGKIHLRFDSKSAIDRQERTILVNSNALNSPHRLIFKCIVLKKKK